MPKDLEEALSELNNICNDCKRSNWDGYGADKVTEQVKDKAILFLKKATKLWGVPSISAEPDGEISFEWYVTINDIISISIGEEKEGVYAALIGDEKFCGNFKKIEDLTFLFNKIKKNRHEQLCIKN